MITHKRKVFTELISNFPDGVSNITLNQICFRYGARVHELRRSPHNLDIESFRVRTNAVAKQLDDYGVRYYKLNTDISNIDMDKMSLRV